MSLYANDIRQYSSVPLFFSCRNNTKTVLVTIDVGLDWRIDLLDIQMS
jgi:hypothetical protein